MPGAPHDPFAREVEGVLEKYYALKEARQRHPYVGDLIGVLLPYPEGLRRQLALYELEKQRKQEGLPIPAAFKAAVQSSSTRRAARDRDAGRSTPSGR